MRRFILGLVCFSVVSLQGVWAQQYPPYIEQQIRAGTLTRSEARLLYGNPTVKSPSTPGSTPPAPSALSPKAAPETASQEEAKVTPAKTTGSKAALASKADDKAPSYRGTFTGLEPSGLTAATGQPVAGSVYLLPNSPEIQELLKQQQNLINQLRRTSGPSKLGRSRQPNSIGDAPAGTFSEAPGGGGAALTQLGGFGEIATGNALAQAALTDGAFAIESALPSGLVMAVVSAGGRTIGVWALPAVKDEPLALSPANALYWIP
ncbi:RAD23 family protein [Anthocerotibacter panamensis]|uniref:hypothetical protein n=1 Tax=Anthocerotibacter panamensis TaxID=2857077 RepID=UPI001C407FF7|nr:hypothetical protein [Anthocerotibacter panamensis]